METVWGLGGIVLGSVATWFGVWLGDRRRWQREDRQRWHERRLHAYTTTLSGLTAIVALSRAGLAAARPILQPPLAPYRLKRTMAQAQDALVATLAELEVIRLVGDRQVVAAAERCLDLLGQFSETLSSWSRATPDSVIDDLVRQLAQAKTDLRSAARAELDVDDVASSVVEGHRRSAPPYRMPR